MQFIPKRNKVNSMIMNQNYLIQSIAKWKIIYKDSLKESQREKQKDKLREKQKGKQSEKLKNLNNSRIKTIINHKIRMGLLNLIYKKKVLINNN